jgi:hypothetical protein
VLGEGEWLGNTGLGARNLGATQSREIVKKDDTLVTINPIQFQNNSGCESLCNRPSLFGESVASEFERSFSKMEDTKRSST